MARHVHHAVDEQEDERADDFGAKRLAPARRLRRGGVHRELAARDRRSVAGALVDVRDARIEQTPRQRAAENRGRELNDDVDETDGDLHLSGEDEEQRDGRVEVAARDAAKRSSHGSKCKALIVKR